MRKLLIALALLALLLPTVANAQQKSKTEPAKHPAIEDTKPRSIDWVDPKTKQAATVLFRFEDGKISGVLQMRRADGEEIPVDTDGKTLLLPADSEIITELNLKNEGGRVQRYPVVLKGTGGNIKDYLNITKIEMQVGSGGSSAYDLNKIFGRDGVFLPEIFMDMPSRSEVFIRMFSQRDKK